MAERIARQALTVAEQAEAFAGRVADLLDGLNAERRAREAAEAKARELEKRLAARDAEFARFNGHDWPKEVEAAQAREKTARAELGAAQEQVRHLKDALRSLTLASEKVA